MRTEIECDSFNMLLRTIHEALVVKVRIAHKHLETFYPYNIERKNCGGDLLVQHFVA